MPQSIPVCFALMVKPLSGAAPDGDHRTETGALEDEQEHGRQAEHERDGESGLRSRTRGHVHVVVRVLRDVVVGRLSQPHRMASDQAAWGTGWPRAGWNPVVEVST